MPMTINPSLKSSMDALRILVSETPKSGAVGEPDQVIALIEQLSELSKSGPSCPKSADLYLCKLDISQHLRGYLRAPQLSLVFSFAQSYLASKTVFATCVLPAMRLQTLKQLENSAF